MKFFLKLTQKHAENAFTGIQDFIINLDPETASEAQIDEFMEQLEKASMELAKARLDYQKEQKEADTIVALFNQRMKAAEIMQSKIDGADGDKSALEQSLESLLNMIEEMSPEVDREKEEAEYAKQMYDELTSFVEESATTLKTARQRLEKAQKEMKRADLEKEKAQKHADRVATLAGIKNKGAGFNTALDAMEKKAKQSKIEAEAANIRTSLLATANTEKDDSNIAAALAEAAGEAPSGKESLADRLARLKKK